MQRCACLWLTSFLFLLLPPFSKNLHAAPSVADVTSLTLINADTDQPMPGFDPLTNGTTLDLNTLPTTNLNIRANVGTGSIGSIQFRLDDNYNFNIENAAPYALTGDTNGDFFSWTPALGEHTVGATPFDGANATGSQGTPLTVTFVVTTSASGNIPPTVYAGSDAVKTLPDNSGILVGSASDTDGTITALLWTQEEGPAPATLSNATTNELTINDLVAGNYRFRLTATDNAGATAYDEAWVYVYPGSNQSPNVSAGQDAIITLPQNSTGLAGTASDSDGTITALLWTQEEGPSTATLIGANTTNLTASDLVAGSYRFRLTATDDDGATAHDDAWIYVQSAANQPPQVTVQNDVNLTLPTNATTLTSTSSDSDGTITNYAWSKQEGPEGVSYSGENSDAVTVSNLLEGNYRFRLTVTDDDGATAHDDVWVTVEPGSGSGNMPPTVDAGAPVTVTLPTNFVFLTGAATDSDGSINGLQWSQLSGPNSPQLQNAATGTLEVWGIVEGVYTFQLEATDNEGATNSDTVVVTVIDPTAVAPTVSGDLVKWHPIIVSFAGLTASETDDAPNPFLDYRLTVIFTAPNGEQTAVPGFFDGDGVGGGTGNVWRVRFSADQPGLWSYTAHFDSGSDIAVDLNLNSGTPTSFDGATGTFTVADRNPHAPGFLRYGRLGYVGEHYLKHADGPWFLKGGIDSPENLLAYAGFDGTEDRGCFGGGLQNGVHHYANHVQDWNAGDPNWTATNSYGTFDAKGIIGALNYLESVHINSIYFLTMNLGGDGCDTYPFLAGTYGSDYDKTHYDISKLHQWNMLFDYAQRKGMQAHVVLGETENGNEEWLDYGNLGVQRKLFYREMAARYSYVMGIKWNIGEEFDTGLPKLNDFAGYLSAVDWAGHPVGVHTLPNNWQYYDQIKGQPNFDITSIQYSTFLDSSIFDQWADSHTEKWRTDSAQAGRKWVVDMDENNPGDVGLTAWNTDVLRKRILYGVLFSGGNIEWFMGENIGDIELEDFRTREAMWNYTWYARKLLIEHTPFHQMEPNDDLLNYFRDDGQVFRLPDVAYAIYLPDGYQDGSPVLIDLSESDAGTTFTKRWYNPRSGEFVGSDSAVVGGGMVDLGLPPQDWDEDWVILFSTALPTGVGLVSAETTSMNQIPVLVCSLLAMFTAVQLRKAQLTGF